MPFRPTDRRQRSATGYDDTETAPPPIGDVDDDGADSPARQTHGEDIVAFAETCRSVGAPVAIERSRSGNGAHAWFFFTAPVSANVARRMGCYLITETMSRRHELSMESYDRLFPNQDTLPRGGFGNLIALPLQHEARQQGNSVFNDEQLEECADQWAFLASVQRIEPAAAEAIAREATRTGQVVRVRFSEDLDDEASAAPWMRLPPGRITISQIAASLPSKVAAVLSQRLFIEKAGLPPPLLNQLKRLAAFQNPESSVSRRTRYHSAVRAREIGIDDPVAPVGRHHNESGRLERRATVHVETDFSDVGPTLPVDDHVVREIRRDG